MEKSNIFVGNIYGHFEKSQLKSWKPMKIYPEMSYTFVTNWWFWKGGKYLLSQQIQNLKLNKIRWIITTKKKSHQNNFADVIAKLKFESH